MQEFPVSDSLGLPWGWTELDLPALLVRSCLVGQLELHLQTCLMQAVLVLQQAGCTAGVPNQGLAPVPVGSCTALKPCSLASRFVEWNLARLTVLPKLIPDFPHTLCLCKAVSSTGPCVAAWLLELSGNFQGKTPPWLLSTKV